MPTDFVAKQVAEMSAEGYPLVDDGTWCEVKPHVDPSGTAGRPGLFLDRDGVVVEEVIYLHKPDEVALIPGAARIIAAANAAGVPVVLVTNQSGVGRGYYTWADFRATQTRVEQELAGEGARLDMVVACPFTPGGEGPYRHPDHLDRKPNPGMLLRGQRCLGLDLSRSWIVGDRGLDIQAGRRAGLAGGVHVATGFGTDPDERREALAQARDGVAQAASQGEGYRVLTAPAISETMSILERLR